MEPCRPWREVVSRSVVRSCSAGQGPRPPRGHRGKRPIIRCPNAYFGEPPRIRLPTANRRERGTPKASQSGVIGADHRASAPRFSIGCLWRTGTGVTHAQYQQREEFDGFGPLRRGHRAVRTGFGGHPLRRRLCPALRHRGLQTPQTGGRVRLGHRVPPQSRSPREAFRECRRRCGAPTQCPPDRVTGCCASRPHRPRSSAAA